jgi:hypothetical protein
MPVEVGEDLALPAQKGPAQRLEFGQERGRRALEEVLEGMGGAVDSARPVEAVEGFFCQVDLAQIGIEVEPAMQLETLPEVESEAVAQEEPIRVLA